MNVALSISLAISVRGTRKVLTHIALLLVLCTFVGILYEAFLRPKDAGLSGSIRSGDVRLLQARLNLHLDPNSTVHVDNSYNMWDRIYNRVLPRPDVVKEFDVSLLSYSVMSHNSAAVQILIRSAANARTDDIPGLRSPIVYAVIHDDKEIVNLLLAGGAHWEDEDDRHISARTWALSLKERTMPIALPSSEGR